MSVNNIGSAAARLNSFNQPSTASEATAQTNTNSQATDPNHIALSGKNGSNIPTYNKQSLIFSYLGRGKDTVGPPRQIGPAEDPNKQKTNNSVDELSQLTRQSDTNKQKNNNINVDPSLRENPKNTSNNVQKEKEKGKNMQVDMSLGDCIARTEQEYCQSFGATTVLPKIKKLNTQMNEDARMKKLEEVQKRLEEIKELEKQSKEFIDLTFENDSPMEDSQDQSNTLPKSSFSEGGLSFDFSKAPDANSLGLPLFFHKNMQTLQGTLPLTIFNKAWQQAASDNHINYKKSDKEVEKYRGHPYPGEWSQSRFDWNENFDSFMETCCKTYKYLTFANALELHKKNVIRIFKEQRSWVIAFRYDLTIWKATFAVRNPDEKIPNPALEPAGLVTEIYYSARAQDDLNCDENPYQQGGPKFGRNPYSDIITDQSSSQSNLSRSVAGLSRSHNIDRSQFKLQTPYGNYRGKNFNPNYKRPENGKMDNFKGKEKEKKM